jgi:hypothetical protein
MTNQRGWFSLDEVSGVPIPFGDRQELGVRWWGYFVSAARPAHLYLSGVAALVMWIREKKFFVVR